MLRIKRSIQAQFNTQVNFMSAQMLAAASGYTTDSTPSELGAGVDEMAVLEEQARKIAEVAKKDQPKPKTTVAFVKSQDATEEMESMVRAEANPDEIDLGDDEEEELSLIHI